MGEVWPEAQAHVARELGTGMPEAVVFAPNTHDLLVRLFAAAAAAASPMRVLTSDGEFHSARRQLARWEEAGAAVSRTHLRRSRSTPSPCAFSRQRSRADHDLIFVSQVLFGSGRTFDGVEELASLGSSAGPWVVIDGYHAFMALERPFGEAAAKSAFYLGGGYKYAMAGEGCAFMHAPPGFGPRPPITGWFAEFEDLSLPPRQRRLCQGRETLPWRYLRSVRPLPLQRRATDAAGKRPYDGADFRLTSPALQQQLLGSIGETPLADAELLNPLDGGPHARFLAFRSRRTPSAGTRSSRRRTASPTCAATC